MRKRATGLILTLALIAFAGCGGREDAMTQPPDRPSGATRLLSIPEPIPAMPALKVELRETVPDETRTKLEKLPGVAIVTAVARQRFLVGGPKGSYRMTVASTRPLRFRSVAPASSKEAEFVWSSLIAGASVVSFPAAEKLGLKQAGEIAVGDHGTIEVGAFAANGTPDIADVLVGDHVGRELDMGEADLFIVGASPGADIDEVERRIEQGLRGFDVDIRRMVARTPAPLEPAAEPQPVGVAEGGVIGSMSFRILKDGFIDPDPAWVAANIASGEVPILGSVTCHRLVFPQLHAALTEVSEAGLADEIDPSQYGGCYVPRFIDRDPDKPLSMHAFGLAFDINVSTNHLGTVGDQHPEVVEIFERWGFEWGGAWDRPDPMHFELVRLIQT